MKAFLSPSSTEAEEVSITVTGSKSESNRLLILQALYPNIIIKNISNSDDSKFLKNGIVNSEGVVDVHHAGTAMRFLTAYFASQIGTEVVLTGSERMQERPIGILVDALRQLGADIQYTNKEGYPPLKIKGSVLGKSSVAIQANVSSQYISALLLIAPRLPNGLTIDLIGELTSLPYINMTLSLLENVGVSTLFSENRIQIPRVISVKDTIITIESDWSSASYFYSVAALSNKSITLGYYHQESLQGDTALASLYRQLGVVTTFNKEKETITLRKEIDSLKEHVFLDLVDTPDIAQTIVVTCLGLEMGCTLTGLHTLKIKETDRLVALKTELSKLGASVTITHDTLVLNPSILGKERIAIDTYNDHRMAMAFAPLGTQIPITINNCEVVSKSFPSFWEDMQKVGIETLLK